MTRLRLLAWLAAGLLPCSAVADTHPLPEYQLKAAFLYNFVLFTEWPAAVGTTLTLCVLGPDPFGRDVDGLEGKAVGARALTVRRRVAAATVDGCHVVFVAAPAIGQLPRVAAAAQGQPLLIVADSPGALRQGATLNMRLVQDRIAFEANLGAARAAGLTFSSRLLRLAVEVLP